MTANIDKRIAVGAGFTADPVTPPAVGANQVEFLRLPSPGRLCPLSGLSRSYLNQLILPCSQNDFKPPVKSFVLRKRGAQKGVRLIDYASLRAFIRAHEQPALMAA
jgi:hypothetical protein